MRVNSTTRSGGVAKGRGASRNNAPSGAFELNSSQQAAKTASAKSARAISGVDALLALQGVPDATSGRARAIRRGADMLDVLEDIRLDLLAGQIPEHRLLNLLAIVAKKSAVTDDQDLQNVLDEIELRARVELAKFGH